MKVKCDHCRKIIDVPSEYANQTVNCTLCQESTKAIELSFHFRCKNCKHVHEASYDFLKKTVTCHYCKKDTVAIEIKGPKIAWSSANRKKKLIAITVLILVFTGVAAGITTLVLEPGNDSTNNHITVKPDNGDDGSDDSTDDSSTDDGSDGSTDDGEAKEHNIV
ncbi:MAG: hypothetical protein MJH11_19295, partial [Lentisphaeria bacterium]|nr:hypothetical protein [Lentisphaeria bacterium]